MNNPNLINAVNELSTAISLELDPTLRWELVDMNKKLRAVLQKRGVFLGKPEEERPLYYEIIDTKYTGHVVGVAPDPLDCDEDGHVFGEISPGDYERFSDNDWRDPISKPEKRFVVNTEKKVVPHGV